MRTVAKRLLTRLPTPTKGDSAGTFRYIFDRGKFTALVATIAKGLIATLAASAPEIIFAFFYLYAVWAVLCCFAIAHVELDSNWLCAISIVYRTLRTNPCNFCGLRSDGAQWRNEDDARPITL